METPTLSYGVIPIKASFPNGMFKLPQAIMEQLKGKKLLQKGQRALIIHGQHWKRPGSTNALAVITIS